MGDANDNARGWILDGCRLSWGRGNCGRLLRYISAVIRGYKWTHARFAPAKAGACAHLRGCAAPVGSQAFCCRMVDYIAGLLSTIIRRTQWQLYSCNHRDQRERVFTNRAASANRQPGLRVAPAEAGARAHLRGCAATVGSQAFGDRMVRSMRVCYPRSWAYTNCNRILRGPARAQKKPVP